MNHVTRMKQSRKNTSDSQQKLMHVTCYKYLGVIVGKRDAKQLELNRLLDMRKTRLRIMRIIAWGIQGVSVSVLRIMYITYVRSEINAALNLIRFEQKQTQ